MSVLHTQKIVGALVFLGATYSRALLLVLNGFRSCIYNRVYHEILEIRMSPVLPKQCCKMMQITEIKSVSVNYGIDVRDAFAEMFLVEKVHHLGKLLWWTHPNFKDFLFNTIGTLGP